MVLFQLIFTKPNGMHFIADIFKEKRTEIQECTLSWSQHPARSGSQPQPSDFRSIAVNIVPFITISQCLLLLYIYSRFSSSLYKQPTTKEEELIKSERKGRGKAVHFQTDSTEEVMHLFAYWRPYLCQFLHLSLLTVGWIMLCWETTSLCPGGCLIASQASTH